MLQPHLDTLLLQRGHNTQTASTQPQPARWRRWRSCRGRCNFGVFWCIERRFRLWFSENLSAGCFMLSSYWLQRSVWCGQHMSNTCPLDVCLVGVGAMWKPQLVTPLWIHKSANDLRFDSLGDACIYIHVFIFACQCQHVRMDFFVDLYFSFHKVLAKCQLQINFELPSVTSVVSDTCAPGPCPVCIL